MVESAWKIRPGVALYRRCWDDGCVVYDESSGRTVFVDEIGAALLEHLHAVTETTTVLIAWLAEQYDMDPGEVRRQEVVKRLRNLQAVDLVRIEPR